VADLKTDLPKLRSRVSVVFEYFELGTYMSVIDNLAPAQVKMLDRSRDEAIERGRKHLDRVGLNTRAGKYPGQPFGGQQQPVAIARGLSIEPIAMPFDEPTLALDPEMIKEAMVELAHEDMTMIVVTHELGFPKNVANRVIFMDRGEIVADAEDDFFGKPRSERAVLSLSKDPPPLRENSPFPSLHLPPAHGPDRPPR